MLESILTRRSIRSYKSDPVPAEILDQLIRAGMSAPSAWNEQIWHFVVITDRQKLDMIPRFHRYAQMLKSAPAAILVCGDISLEKEKGFWYQDCAAAAENILVAANMLGLGGVWVGIYPIKERIQKISARLARAGLSDAVVRRVCGENAVAFLGADPDAAGRGTQRARRR